MSNGRCSEVDEPQVLLQRPGSELSALVDAAGPAAAAHLRGIAAAAAAERASQPPHARSQAALAAQFTAGPPDSEGWVPQDFSVMPDVDAVSHVRFVEDGFEVDFDQV